MNEEFRKRRWFVVREGTDELADGTFTSLGEGGPSTLSFQSIREKDMGQVWCIGLMEI